MVVQRWLVVVCSEKLCSSSNLFFHSVQIFGAFANELDAQRTFREVFLLRFFNGHPNFVRFVNLIPSDTKDDIYLVFEYMGVNNVTIIFHLPKVYLILLCSCFLFLAKSPKRWIFVHRQSTRRKFVFLFPLFLPRCTWFDGFSLFFSLCLHFDCLSLLWFLYSEKETDLHCAIRAKGLLTDLHIEYITFQLIRSLLYMHSAQIVHRDIKVCHRPHSLCFLSCISRRRLFLKFWRPLKAFCMVGTLYGCACTRFSCLSLAQ